MRTSIAITLIVCGTLLVMLPPASDLVHTWMTVELLGGETARSVMVGGRMGDFYRLGCFTLGTAVMATGVGYCLVAPTPSRRTTISPAAAAA